MGEWLCPDTGKLAVLLIFGTPFIAVVGGILIKVLRIVTGNPSRGESQRTRQNKENEEAKLMQEIYQGLSRMERRIEALETILIERDREERSS